ncbi:MAG TPA: hypothetical protein VIB47_00560 [Dehalococcoidia bacterium]
MGIRIETIAIGAGLLVMAALIFAFASIADGVNQDPSTIVRDAPAPAGALDRNAAANPTTEASPAASPPADVVAPTVTADAPIVFGSLSMLTNTARDFVQLDVDACLPGAGSVDVRLGKLNFEMRGRDGSDCQLDYGTNIEDANPDGIWTATCRVPSKLGRVKLATRDDGADFSPLDPYCSQD